VTPGPAAALALYDVDPDTVAALVLACPAVAGLSGGPSGGAATYLPGRKVAGVRISPDTVEVHVVARYGPTVGELAGQVRSALAGRVLGRTVDLVVEDLDVEDLHDRPDTVAQSMATRPAPTVALPGGVPVLTSPLTDAFAPPTTVPTRVAVDPGEALPAGEVPGTLPAPPDPVLPDPVLSGPVLSDPVPPSPSATRPSRWTRPGRQG
jgi:hypothetical protein